MVYELSRAWPKLAEGKRLRVSQAARELFSSRQRRFWVQSVICPTVGTEDKLSLSVVNSLERCLISKNFLRSRLVKKNFVFSFTLSKLFKRTRKNYHFVARKKFRNNMYGRWSLKLICQAMLCSETSLTSFSCKKK